MSSFRLFSSRARQQSEPDVSPELREQIVNIVDDLVDRISPDYLLPNPIFPFKSGLTHSPNKGRECHKAFIPGECLNDIHR